MKTTNVAAGVLLNERNEFLLATRPEGKAYAGWWEFPGGKIEDGESPREAAVRELNEELGIVVEEAFPWLTETFVYPHTTVRLQFFLVTRWQGEPHPHEGQTFSWHPVGVEHVEHILPANLPILKALALPQIYAITCAEELGEAEQLRRLDVALAQGLRLVQIRDKTWPVAQRHAFAETVMQRCQAVGARVFINSDLALARRLGAGVHFTAAQLMALTEKPDLPCGASCHTLDEVLHAERLELDYVLVGPVLPTATHPGEPTLGWEGFAHLLHGGCAVPVYAIGGLAANDLDVARQHSAHGIAMMRGAWPE